MGHRYNDYDDRPPRGDQSYDNRGSHARRGAGAALKRLPKALLVVGGIIIVLILLVVIPLIIMVIIGLLSGDPIGRANDAITWLNNAIKPVTDLINNIQSIGGGEGGNS